MSFIDEIPEINKIVSKKLLGYKKTNELNYQVESYFDSNIDKMLDDWCNKSPEESLEFMEYMKDFCNDRARTELEKASQFENIANIIRETLENNK